MNSILPSIRESNPWQSGDNRSCYHYTNGRFAVYEGIEPSPHDRQSCILAVRPINRILYRYQESNLNPHLMKVVS
jgi:hypothetical protein